MADKKIALVTGANKGIGFETVKRLATTGFRVYLGSRDKLKGQAAIDKLHRLGLTDTFLMLLNISDSDSIQTAVNEFREKETRLDVLINNAAIGGQQPQSASAVSLENLTQVFNTNFFGAIRVTQAFIPLMKIAPEPRIVNVSSELGSLSFLSGSNSSYFAETLMAYSCSKAALNAFTLLLSGELRNTNFKINSVSPGFTRIDLTSNLGGQSAEQASAIIVKYAIIDNKGPSGEFFASGSSLPW